MTNGFSTRSAVRSLRRSKSPGEAEFNTLLQLFNQPVLLLDNSREQVGQANSAFLQLTAFASTEIAGKPLRTLFSGLPDHTLSADDLTGVMLERRNRQPLPVNVKIRALDAFGQWLVLFVEPREDPKKNLMHQIDQVLKVMMETGRFEDDEPIRKSLVHVAGMIQQLLDVSVVGIYYADNDAVGTWKAVETGDAGILPEIIPSNEYKRLVDTFIWRPGRRVQTELHRHARINNMTYLATTPISTTGLLVVANKKQEAPEQLNIVLEALAHQINTLISLKQRFVELRRLSFENRRDLSVWQSVAENAQEGILLLEPDLTVRQMNPAAEWMLGYTEWEVKGQLVDNVMIGADRLGPVLETACQGIPTHNMGNVFLHRRNGQTFPAHIEVIPAQREGETLAILIFFRDVSENIEIRNRTQQLEQRAVLGEVTAVFAHEVRNPINNISTGLQLLSVKLPENDPNQENINRLLIDCQRLNHLMESVLNFSRHSEHKFEAVDLNILLGRLMDRWRPRMLKVNVTPFIHVEENTPLIQGDPRSLEQVFTNLISNAVEAMSANGGTLAVRVAPFILGQGHPQVEVTVSDTGPGVPDEVKERIFEPFVTTKSTGTGLGLAITKRIITAHHGSISVNTFPGGTVFHVLLLACEGETV